MRFRIVKRIAFVKRPNESEALIAFLDQEITVAMKQSIQISIAMLMLACVYSGAAEPTKMGEEHFGNKPLNEHNFKDWPGVMPIINDKSRVYHQWVNGSEFCCYRGETNALNKVLVNFAKIKSKKLEVVLRPGPGTAQTFTKGKTVEYDWRIHLNGGIAAHMATRDLGEKIWPTHPILTIRVTDRIDLDSLEIPENVTLLTLADLKSRYAQCLSSSDKTVRGWSCGSLAELDKFDTEIMNQIAAKLDDKDNWVRLNALATLAGYKDVASDHLDQVKTFLKSNDEQLKQQAEKTVVAIQTKSTAQQPGESIHRKIKKFVEARK